MGRRLNLGTSAFFGLVFIAAVARFTASSSGEPRSSGPQVSDDHRDDLIEGGVGDEVYREDVTGEGQVRDEYLPDDVPDLARCLRSERVRECLSGIAFSGIDLEVLSGYLRDEAIAVSVRAELLRAFILATPAGDVPAALDMLGGWVNNRTRMREMLEFAMAGIMLDAPFTAERIAMALSPNQVFAEASSSACVHLARLLAEVRPELLNILDEGALGQWGGDAFTVDSAFYFRSLARQTEPQELIGFVESAIDSPYYADRTAQLLGTSIFINLVSIGRRNEGLVNDVEGLILRALADPRFSIGIATQYRQDFGMEGIEYLAPESQRLIQLEVDRILGMR